MQNTKMTKECRDALRHLDENMKEKGGGARRTKRDTLTRAVSYFRLVEGSATFVSQVFTPSAYATASSGAVVTVPVTLAASSQG